MAMVQSMDSKGLDLVGTSKGSDQIGKTKGRWEL